MSIFKSFAIAAALAGVTIAPAAYADGTAVAVKYSDLDLSTAKGQKTLKYRITGAARQACGERSGAVPLYEQAMIDTCMTKAKADAFATVQSKSAVQMAALPSGLTSLKD